MPLYPTITLQAPGLPDFTPSELIGFYGQKLDLGAATTREVVDDAPDADGTDDTTQLVGARTITLNMIVVPLADGSLWSLRQTLLAFTSPRLRPVMLLQQAADAPVQRIVLRRSQYSDPIGGGPADGTADITVQWIAPFGIIESADLHEQSVFASGGTTSGVSFDWSFDLSFGSEDPVGEATVVNAGTADAYPLLRVYGPCTDPSVTNVTQGKTLAFSGLTVGDGEFLEIDTRANTLFYEGVATDSRYDALNFPTSDWWTLSPGANEVVFEAASYSPPSQCQFVFRDAWL